MVANIEGLAEFMERNRHRCEIFYARHEFLWDHGFS